MNHDRRLEEWHLAEWSWVFLGGSPEAQRQDARGISWQIRRPDCRQLHLVMMKCVVSLLILAFVIRFQGSYRTATNGVDATNSFNGSLWTLVIA